MIKIIFLSYFSLWKYGGTYLDLDVIVKKGLNILKPNYAGAESEKAVAAGVLNFDDKNFGHQIADMCIRLVRTNSQILFIVWFSNPIYFLEKF